MNDDTERCAFCGATVESPCEEPPVDTCEKALNATYGDPLKKNAPRARVPVVGAKPGIHTAQLIDMLQAAADDPMWANHAEVSKQLLALAAERLRRPLTDDKRQALGEVLTSYLSNLHDADEGLALDPYNSDDIDMLIDAIVPVINQEKS